MLLPSTERHWKPHGFLGHRYVVGCVVLPCVVANCVPIAWEATRYWGGCLGVWYDHSLTKYSPPYMMANYKCGTYLPCPQLNPGAQEIESGASQPEPSDMVYYSKYEVLSTKKLEAFWYTGSKFLLPKDNRTQQLKESGLILCTVATILWYTNPNPWTSRFVWVDKWWLCILAGESALRRAFRHIKRRTKPYHCISSHHVMTADTVTRRRTHTQNQLRTTNAVLHGFVVAIQDFGVF